MKRTNVIVDEELLERARLVTGEKTYSGVINFALGEIVRRHARQRAFDDLLAAAKEGPLFHPGYAEELYPVEEKRRISADERRLPKRKSRRAPR
jgi:hypothetical protein